MLSAFASAAQDWPGKPIRIVVPFLAVATAERSPALLDVPTLKELGFRAE